MNKVLCKRAGGEKAVAAAASVGQGRKGKKDFDEGENRETAVGCSLL